MNDDIYDGIMTPEEQAFAEEYGADVVGSVNDEVDEEAEADRFRQQQKIAQKEIAQMLCEAYNTSRKDSLTYKDITIRKQTLPIPYVYEGQQYTMASIEAIAQLVKTKGSREHTVIIYSENGIKAVLDDTVQHRRQDTAKFVFEDSDEWKEWNRFASKPQISQKDFVDFLRKREKFEVLNVDGLMAKIQNLKIATEIVGDFNYDDNNNVSVMLKIKDKEQAIKLPREIEIFIPLFRNSVDNFPLKFDLELFKPKAENEKPYFTLACSNYDKIRRRAIEAEIEKLENLLSEYLILTGKF
jgi:hypothetical protein